MGGRAGGWEGVVKAERRGGRGADSGGGGAQQRRHTTSSPPLRPLSLLPLSPSPPRPLTDAPPAILRAAVRISRAHLVYPSRPMCTIVDQHAAMSAPGRLPAMEGDA